MSVRIKICGITQYEDARAAINLGVDALGFNFYPKSPRYITPSRARTIIDRLPPFVSKVGVFVDAGADEIAAAVRETGIDTLQLHGAETAEFCGRMPLAVIKTFSVGPEFDPAILGHYQVSGFLLDTWDPAKKGGTGRTFDWSVARRAAAKYDRVIIAGGLGPSNVAEALSAVRPYGVDLNSGVEIRPGVKNPHKMREAVGIVRGFK